jgi:UDP-N-acetylglucosamine diphosphorylase/glucosamine-1-phosphate N-acetyltransferase
MALRVIVYEDSGWKRLLPLVYSRAVFQLWCGSSDLLSRAKRLVDSRLWADLADGQIAQFQIWCRPELAQVVSHQTGLPANQPGSGALLLLNGRGIWKSIPAIDGREGSWVGTLGPEGPIACIHADEVLASRLTSEALLDQDELLTLVDRVPRRDVGSDVTLLDWPWQFVNANRQQLTADWHDDLAGIAGIAHAGSHLVNPRGIHIGWGAKIKPCVVIDAEDGPVWIGENVTVFPHSYIRGPAFIGDGSLIQPGAVVQGGTTIGPRSKIGGEIEGSIIQGFSNKQHDGFLGHSYLGSWVNLAADCINSDLKNTYGNVRVPINGREVESNEMFVGMYMGDYSKAGINVSFPTGAVIGFCSNVFAARSPKFVPSFTWMDGESVQDFDAERGLATARKVMARRQCTMTAPEEQLFLAVRNQALALEEHSGTMPLIRDGR